MVPTGEQMSNANMVVTSVVLVDECNRFFLRKLKGSSEMPAEFCIFHPFCFRLAILSESSPRKESGMHNRMMDLHIAMS